MLIRSQDKKSFINMNTVSQLYVDDDDNITADFNNSDDDGFEIIGQYSSEAKAIKVLDMIQAEYIKVRISLDKQGYIEEVFNLPKVFQMPSDEEVEG